MFVCIQVLYITKKPICHNCVKIERKYIERPGIGTLEQKYLSILNYGIEFINIPFIHF